MVVCCHICESAMCPLPILCWWYFQWLWGLCEVMLHAWPVFPRLLGRWDEGQGVSHVEDREEVFSLLSSHASNSPHLHLPNGLPSHSSVGSQHCSLLAEDLTTPLLNHISYEPLWLNNSSQNQRLCYLIESNMRWLYVITGRPAHCVLQANILIKAQ